MCSNWEGVLGGRACKLTPRDSKGLTKELVSQVSSGLRKIGCRCVLDETIRDKSRSKPVHIDCINRFEPLSE